MAKRISILGSTGSIGQSTLSLIRDAQDGAFELVSLTAHSSAALLAEQALEFRPKFVALVNENNKQELTERLSGSGIKVGFGPEALFDAATRPADLIMAGIVGAAGLEPTLAAVDQGTTIALANKECLVCAGDLFMRRVREAGAMLLPVDSEHNAIFQVLAQKRPQDVRKLILTASGGPFREFSTEQLKSVSKEQALAHPVWDMGAKISIDSATLMNKGLELIEASFLFNRPSQDIDIIIHPQSIIHSMVEYVDGSVLAQMGSPDMRVPIAYALAWPQRMHTHVNSLNLADIGKLEFFPPDPIKFPALRLARAALETGGMAPTVLNAANEVAVARFLQGGLSFKDITSVLELTLNCFENEKRFAKPPRDLADVLDIDRRARVKTDELAHKL